MRTRLDRTPSGLLLPRGRVRKPIAPEDLPPGVGDEKLHEAEVAAIANMNGFDDLDTLERQAEWYKGEPEARHIATEHSGEGQWLEDMLTSATKGEMMTPDPLGQELTRKKRRRQPAARST